MKRAFRRPAFLLLGAMVVLAALPSGRTITHPCAGVVERPGATTNTAGAPSATDGRQMPGYDPRQAVSAVVRHLNTMTFAPGQQAGFIGIYSHTESPFDLNDQFTSTEWLLRDNPFITGVSPKIRWHHWHPEKSLVYWDKLERLIALVISFALYAAEGRAFSGSL